MSLLKTIILSILITITPFTSFAALKIGVSSIVSAETNLKMYEGLSEYLSKKLATPAEIIYRKNYKDMNELIQKKEVDIAFVCTGAFVSMNSTTTEIIVVPQVSQRITYNSIMITNKQSKITSIKDMKYKTLALTDPLSNTGYIYPVYYLIKNGIKNRSYFKKVYYTYSHDKSIYLVNKGVVDVAFVDHMVFDYIKKRSPKDVENIQILHKSPDFPNPPIVFSSNHYNKEQLDQIFLNMHRDPEGAKILRNLNIERFVKIDNKMYNEVIKIKQEVDKHLSNESSKIF